MHTRGWVRVLALALALLCVLGTPALSEHAAQVSAAYIPVYADAALTNWIGALNQGASVTVHNEANGVAAITWNGQRGYVSASGLQAVSTPTPESGVVYETFPATVCVQNAYVYATTSTSAASIPVPYGMALTVVAYDDTWAYVFNGSMYAYIPRSSLTTGSVSTPTPTPTPESGVVYETFPATVCVQNAYVYATTSTSAASIPVPYGMALTVVAYDDTWAYVFNGSMYAYIPRSSLTTGSVSTPTPTPTPTPSGGSTSFDQAVASGNYSNEQLTFLYLTQEAGLNTAAACGVMANIKAESSFRPTALSSGGGSYGICQWTGSRRTRLQNYCANRGLDYTTLTAQLQFLEYELENYYPKVMNYIRAVDNTAQGAYDAGYYFCYHFEAPSNRASRSVTRGNSARDTYWPRYA